MKYADSCYELSTGKTFYSNNGLIGIGLDEGEIEIVEGYDGHVDEKFTLEEKREIALHCISLWKKWAELDQ